MFKCLVIFYRKLLINTAELVFKHRQTDRYTYTCDNKTIHIWV